MGHAAFLSPFLHGADEGFGDFRIVDEVNPSEADVFLVPGLVGLVVDDGGYASYYPVVLVGEEIVSFTELECSILLLVEGVEHVVVKVGDRVGVALI